MSMVKGKTASGKGFAATVSDVLSIVKIIWILRTWFGTSPSDGIEVPNFLLPNSHLG